MGVFVLCSDCFKDQGLRLDAIAIGVEDNTTCPNCGSSIGRKLSADLVEALAHRFFVWGTLQRVEYGAAPVVQFNNHQKTSINAAPWFEPDLHLIEKRLGVGFFHYGPRLWMVGEVEPLQALKRRATRGAVISRIISEYPTMTLMSWQTFYRIRKAPGNPSSFAQYDSPPARMFARCGRLDSTRLPVMYGSQDLPVCVHECRVTAEDDLFVATLSPTKNLRLLDLTELLQEKDATEFESLDMAVNMLFLAGKHSYPITRQIALAAHAANYDGLVYPSYFSLLRTGGMPFETVYGISHRRIPALAANEKSKVIANLALFGRPIAEGKTVIQCINRLILTRVDHGFHFGPVGY
jgi:hypothetical protein